jgi:hypothetical protein
MPKTMNARKKMRIERLTLMPILTAVLEAVVGGEEGELAMFEANGAASGVEAAVAIGTSIWDDEAVLYSSCRAGPVVLGDADCGSVPEEMSDLDIQTTFAVYDVAAAADIRTTQSCILLVSHGFAHSGLKCAYNATCRVPSSEPNAVYGPNVWCKEYYNKSRKERWHDAEF